MLNEKELAVLKENTKDVLEASLGVEDYVQYVLELLGVPDLMEDNQ